MNDMMTTTIAPITPAISRKKTVTTEIADGAVIYTAAGSEPVRYGLDGIPAALYDRLAVIGLRYLLVGADDAAAVYAGLVAGSVPGRKAAAPKAEKAPKPLTPERALIVMTRTEHEAGASEPKVKKHLPGGKIAPDWSALFAKHEADVRALDAKTARAEYTRIVATMVSAKVGPHA